MSHVVYYDRPCPKCGRAREGWDLRGKWRGPDGDYYCFGCAPCGQYFADPAMTQTVERPACMPPMPLPAHRRPNMHSSSAAEVGDVQ